jgi:2-ketoarginine methyltransferase
MIPADFQRRLIENIQPIRYFVLAQALHHAMDRGVLTAIEESPGSSEGALADRLGLDSERLLALLHFLQNEGYVVAEQGWRLTAKGAGVRPFAPWYEMLVGGYAPAFVELGDVLADGARYATRDGARVGSGSCGVGAWDTLPLVEKLLAASDRDLSLIVDLGCGDAAFLINIMERHPGLAGIGLEPNEASAARGISLGRQAGVGGRLTVHTGTAADVARLALPSGGRGTVFLTAFVLQEMLEQDGEDAVGKLLRTTFDSYPDALWMVAEMDYQPASPVMVHGLAMAFYNPYYLIHAITQQRLLTNEQWRELFSRAGLRCLSVAYPDDRVDSTGLQVGYLLARS